MASVATATAAAPTLQEFEDVLSRHDSATRALEEWCAMRGIADPPHVTAHPVDAPLTAPAEIVEKLAVGPHGTFAHRNVRLTCGETVLSVARNWYVPARLTPQMNEALRSTDEPFGNVVSALNFRRRPLSTMAGPAENCPSSTISTHRAILYLPSGEPLAYVIECYTAANLSADG